MSSYRHMLLPDPSDSCGASRLQRALRITALCLVAAAVLAPLSGAALADDTVLNTDREYYTVQVASFRQLDSALDTFHEVQSRLEDAFGKGLRLEYLAPFFTVRLGSAESKAGIRPLREEVAAFAPRAIVLSVKILPDRVVLSGEVNRTREFLALEAEGAEKAKESKAIAPEDAAAAPRLVEPPEVAEAAAGATPPPTGEEAQAQPAEAPRQAAAALQEARKPEQPATAPEPAPNAEALPRVERVELETAPVQEAVAEPVQEAVAEPVQEAVAEPVTLVRLYTPLPAASPREQFVPRPTPFVPAPQPQAPQLQKQATPLVAPAAPALPLPAATPEAGSGLTLMELQLAGGALLLLLAGLATGLFLHRYWPSRRRLPARALHLGPSPASETAGDRTGLASCLENAAPGRPLELKLFSSLPTESDARELPGLAPANEALLRKTAAEIQAVLDNLLQLTLRKGLKSIYMTSCAKGDGKTRMAVSLAHALAGQDFRVLLVDANTQNPALSGLYDMPKGPGLLELLDSRSARLAGLVRASRHRNLHLLPLGESGGAAAPERLPLNELVPELCREFDCVILDGQPLSDPFAKLVAAACDGVALVTPWDTEKWHLLRKAVQDITLFGGAVLGVIQNKRRSSMPLFVYRRIMRDLEFGPGAPRAAGGRATIHQPPEPRNRVDQDHPRFLS